MGHKPLILKRPIEALECLRENWHPHATIYPLKCPHIAVSLVLETEQEFSVSDENGLYLSENHKKIESLDPNFSLQQSCLTEGQTL